MSKISTQTLANGCKYVAQYTYVLLTPEQMQDLIAGTHVEESVIEYDGFDTAEREMTMDLLSKKLMGKEWPSNGDSDTKGFIMELLTKAQEYGYKLNMSDAEVQKLNEHIASLKSMNQLTEQAQELKMGY